MNKRIIEIAFFLLIPAISEAAEFANIYDLKVLNTKSQGVGQSLSIETGGYGLVAGFEFKQFESESFPSVYAGLSTGTAQLQLGYNKQGTTLRGGFGIALFEPADYVSHSVVHLKVGYENYFDSEEYSGLYIGLDLMVFE